MGQAQRSRYQGVQYRDVELELWELDNDESGYGRRSGRSYANSRNNSRPTGRQTEADRISEFTSRGGEAPAGIEALRITPAGIGAFRVRRRAEWAIELEINVPSGNYRFRISEDIRGTG